MFNDVIKVKSTSVKKRPAMLAKEIRHILNNLFLKSKINDAYLFDKTFIIADVIVSTDLSIAKIYIMPQALYDNKLIISLLNNHCKFFKHCLGKQLAIKIVPKPIFYIDDSLERAKAVDEMFKKIQ